MSGFLKKIGAFCTQARLFSGNAHGGVMVAFGATLPALVVAGGAALDFGMMTSKRTSLQTVADSSALAAAKEFRLSNSTPDSVQLVAKRYADGLLGQSSETVEPAAAKAMAAASKASSDMKAEVDAKADAVARTVTVVVTADVQTMVMHMFNSNYAKISAKATAKVVGGAPICVIGLDTNSNATVEMDKSAKLEAPNCTVYSNSTKPNGLLAKNSATMKAAFICSAGGKSSPGPGSFSPQPQTDCPVIPDPLSMRPAPVAMGCMMNSAVIKSNATLSPGTYCGGLTITNGANVQFSPGEYIIKDGPLVVTGGATVKGVNTGFYFTGVGARLKLDQQSNVSLTAPRDGLMAGMLFFEDRNAVAGQTHEIISDNAGTLLGTIYLPQGRLHVAANKPVAQNSAYTIVVARNFSLSEGPTMVLNTNYSLTDIPVPVGVGPSGSAPRLIE